VSRNDSSLRLTGGDDSRTVRTDQPCIRNIEPGFDRQHIQRRNAFGNADDQLDAGIECFKDAVFGDWRRYVNHGRRRTGGIDRISNGIKHRQIQMFCAAFARCYTANQFGAIGNGLFTVQGTLRPGETLADDLGVLVDQNAHGLPPAAATTFSAASFREFAGMMLRPLSFRRARPASELLPSKRTTTGTFTPTS
jgi:hypothetical protein